MPYFLIFYLFIFFIKENIKKWLSTITHDVIQKGGEYISQLSWDWNRLLQEEEILNERNKFRILKGEKYTKWDALSL